MDNNGLSAADVALLSNDGMGNGWGGMIWLFAILAMMGGGFGGFGGGYSGNSNAIQADVNRGFDNQNLQAQTRDILAAVTAGTAQAVAATNQVYHDITGYVGDKYTELQRDIGMLAVGQANVLANQNQCCSSTQQLIQQMNYEAAMRDAATNANLVAQTQKILDANANDRFAAMQNRINQLELAQAMNGVVRYPSGWTYNAGNNPFCGCNM